MSSSPLNRTVVVSNPEGLHLRVATELVKLVATYRAKVRLSKASVVADASSVLDLVALDAGQGEVLLVESWGDDAQAALDAVAELFARDAGGAPA